MQQYYTWSVSCLNTICGKYEYIGASQSRTYLQLWLLVNKKYKRLGYVWIQPGHKWFETVLSLLMWNNFKEIYVGSDWTCLTWFLVKDSNINEHSPPPKVKVVFLEQWRGYSVFAQITLCVGSDTRCTYIVWIVIKCLAITKLLFYSSNKCIKICIDQSCSTRLWNLQ